MKLDDIVLTPEEVSNMLKITKNTVYELIKRGELTAYKVGKKVRVDLKDIEEYKNKSKNILLGNDSQELPPSEVSFNASLSQPETLPSGEFVICGQDAMLDILARKLETKSNGIRILRSHMGSYNGLYALYHGTVQIATTHLWDGELDQYNISYIKKLLPGTPAVIVHLACRMQGFYVAKKNPKKISGWEDLKRMDLTIVNREKGSGTRVLLDEHLKILGIHGSEVNGYHKECTSHLAVASAISRGEADLGFGNEMASLSVKGIDFLPIQKERYELVMKKEDTLKDSFQALLQVLQSADFKSELVGIGGYNLEETGNIIAET